MYGKVLQLHTYIYLLFFQFFSYLGYIILSRVPCVLQWVLIITFKYLEMFCSWLFKKLFIYLFLAVLHLCYCSGFSLVAVSRGNSLAVGHGFLVLVASLVAEKGL